MVHRTFNTDIDIDIMSHDPNTTQEAMAKTLLEFVSLFGRASKQVMADDRWMVTGNRKSGNAVTRYDSKSKVLGALVHIHSLAINLYLLLNVPAPSTTQPTLALPSVLVGSGSLYISDPNPSPRR